MDDYTFYPSHYYPHEAGYANSYYTSNLGARRDGWTPDYEQWGYPTGHSYGGGYNYLNYQPAPPYSPVPDAGGFHDYNEFGGAGYGLWVYKMPDPWTGYPTHFVPGMYPGGY